MWRGHECHDWREQLKSKTKRVEILNLYNFNNYLRFHRTKRENDICCYLILISRVPRHVASTGNISTSLSCRIIGSCSDVRVQYANTLSLGAWRWPDRLHTGSTPALNNEDNNLGGCYQTSSLLLYSLMWAILSTVPVFASSFASFGHRLLTLSYKQRSYDPFSSMPLDHSNGAPRSSCMVFQINSSSNLDSGKEPRIPGATKNYHARRPHSKSRQGCLPCKASRVKVGIFCLEGGLNIGGWYILYSATN